jgi:hypothetical protein
MGVADLEEEQVEGYDVLLFPGTQEISETVERMFERKLFDKKQTEGDGERKLATTRQIEP